MANGFSCLICGGKLVIKDLEFAVCQNCQVEYSIESLKARMGNSSVAPTAPVSAKAQAPNVDNILFMAKSAHNNGAYDKAKELCDQILTKDCTNPDAWYYKISSEFKDNNTIYSNSVAAGYFADACGQIKDEAVKKAFIKKVSDLFIGNVSFDEYIADVAKSLCSVSTDVTTRYINKCISYECDAIDKMYDSYVPDLREYARRAKEDSRYYVLNGQNWNRAGRSLSSTLDNLQKLIRTCGSACDILDESKKLCDKIEIFARDAKQYVPGGNYHDELKRKISNIGNTLNDLANKKQQAKELEEIRRLKKQWDNNPEEKEKFKERFDEIKNEIERIKKNKDSLTIKCDKECAELDKKISELKSERSSLGFFKIKEKKSIEGKMLVMMNQIDYKKSDLNDDLKAEDKKIDKLKQEKQKIEELIRRVESL